MCAFPGPPDYVIWEVTLRCNLRCAHCAASAGRPRVGELDQREALSVVDQLIELGVPAVALMGGEVLLRRDWPVIAQRLIAGGTAVGVITNGMLFTEKTLSLVKDLGVVQVGVSLDGPMGVHDRIRGVKGAFDRVMRVLDLVRDSDLMYKTVITSVNRTNFQYLDDILRILLMRAPGFTWMINMTSIHEFTRMESNNMLGQAQFIELARFIGENRRKYRDTLTITATDDMGYFSNIFGQLHETEWKGCQAGIGTLGIRSNGDVTGCSILPDQFIEGNVRQRRLKEIWQDPDCCAYNRRFTRDKLAGICRDCEYGDLCRGGCRDHALAWTGNMYEYPFCLHDLEKKGIIGGK